MIKHIEIQGLNGNRGDSLVYDFNSDLNIFTGQNGCGKTTLLKILWYICSGNINCLLQEVVFHYIKLETDKHKFEIGQVNGKFKIQIDDNVFTPTQEAISLRIQIREFCKNFAAISGKTLFFPTFRRIEGGFSMGMQEMGISQSTVNDSLRKLSDSLSSENHKFIASVSTNDIENLLKFEYADISKYLNDLQKNQFSKIRHLIKNGKTSKENKLNQIEQEIAKTDELFQEKLQPFSVLDKHVKTIYKDKGINVSPLVLGNETKPIVSDKLSAGEKQMLSFLCYNTFYRDCIIFIDEPELSLHIDWQRKLIPVLVNQRSGNQFFIATHSPFIYSVYPDKEIILDRDQK